MIIDWFWIIFLSRNCKKYSFFCVKMLCCCQYSMMVCQHKTFKDVTIGQTVSLHYFRHLTEKTMNGWVKKIEWHAVKLVTNSRSERCFSVSVFFLMCAWINTRVISSLLVIIIHNIPIAIPQQTTTVTALLSSHYCHPHLNEPLFISVLERSLGL